MTYPIIDEAIGTQLDILEYGRSILQDFNLDELHAPVMSKVLLTGNTSTKTEQMEDLFIGKIMFDLINHISATSMIFYPIISDSLSVQSTNVTERRVLGFITTAFLWYVDR